MALMERFSAVDAHILTDPGPTWASRSSTFLCQLSLALLSSCSLFWASWTSAEALSSSWSSFSSSRSFLHSCLENRNQDQSVHQNLPRSGLVL